jgi:hypothetical protein
MSSQDDLTLLKQMFRRGEISEEQYEALRRHVLWGTPLPQLIDDLPTRGGTASGGPAPGPADRGPGGSFPGGPDPRTADRGGPAAGPADRGGPAPRPADRGAGGTFPGPGAADRGPDGSFPGAPGPGTAERGPGGSVPADRAGAAGPDGYPPPGRRRRRAEDDPSQAGALPPPPGPGFPPPLITPPAGAPTGRRHPPGSDASVPLPQSGLPGPAAPPQPPPRTGRRRAPDDPAGGFPPPPVDGYAPPAARDEPTPPADTYAPASPPASGRRRAPDPAFPPSGDPAQESGRRRAPDVPAAGFPAVGDGRRHRPDPAFPPPGDPAQESGRRRSPDASFPPPAPAEGARGFGSPSGGFSPPVADGEARGFGSPSGGFPPPVDGETGRRRAADPAPTGFPPVAGEPGRRDAAGGFPPVAGEGSGRREAAGGFPPVAGEPGRREASGGGFPPVDQAARSSREPWPDGRETREPAAPASFGFGEGPADRAPAPDETAAYDPFPGRPAQNGGAAAYDPFPGRPAQDGGATAYEDVEGLLDDGPGRTRPARKVRKRSVVAVLTSMVLALALVAAGVYWFALREVGVLPADYARSVCGSVRDWQQSVDSAGAALVSSIAREDDRSVVRTAVTTYYTDLAARTDRLRTDLTAAGVADVSGGQAYADSLGAAVGDQATALRDLSARAAKLDPAAAATFQITLQALLTGSESAVSEVSSALARPAAGTPGPLRTALAAEPACAPYVG